MSHQVTPHHTENLTQAQYLMWLGQRVEPNIPLYNMALAYTIHGPVDPELFEAAFNSFVARCDTMRLVVLETAGQPAQQVLPFEPSPLTFLDFSGDPDPLASYRVWEEKRVVQKIDLTRRSYDTALIKISPDQFIWYFNQHHMFTDAWSISYVYRHVAKAYELAKQGQMTQAPDIPAYIDYVTEENAFRESEGFEKARAHWAKKTTARLEPTQFYGLSETARSFATHRVAYPLGEVRSQKLRELAAEFSNFMVSADLVLSNIFLTTLFAYMHRVSGKRNLAVGTPFHNRATRQHRETIGVFIEIGLAQVEIAPQESFNSLLQKTMQETFENLRHALPGISSSTTNRSYDVLLNYINATFPDFAGHPMESEWVHSGYGDSSHLIRLQVHDFDTTGEFVLYFDLNEELFDTDEKRDLVRSHFGALLDAFLSDPDTAIDQANMLREDEFERFIVAMNATTVDYPRDKTIVRLFDEQAKRTPDGVAAALGEQTLSYAALLEAANALAVKLQKRGAGPEKLVGVYMHHTIETVAALLGILKSGSAYVPIDPNYPVERVRYLLEDSGIEILLTQSGLLQDLEKTGVELAQVIPLDSIAQDEAFRPDHALALDPSKMPSPDHLAYVMYTSGSTGRPKGVMIRHQGLTDYVWWAKKMYTAGKQISFPLFSSLSFDLTVTSIFTPLISGGRVVVYPDEGDRGLKVMNVVRDNQVDILKLTPSHLNLIKQLDLGSSRIRKYIVGGEDFKRELAAEIHGLYQGDVALFNEYGPTEAVVGCMIHQYDPQIDTGASVSIGRPAENARIYVLDEHLHPCPVGVVGEIYIGGDGLARGYFQRPALTAERFIPNPFAGNTGQPGSRLYKTGDLGRWMPNGRLDYLGRSDFQVKIGGARIELGEVEAALLEHPLVDEAVVSVQQIEQASPPEMTRRCVRCGLPDNFPDLTIDAEQVCSLCRAYDAVRERAEPYFKTMDELHDLVSQIIDRQADKPYDCLVLLSGGKDSTYMLCQVVEMGLRPLVLTLDNGYISDQAKNNIRKVVNSLGVDHIFGETPQMPAIFADSLERFSNVCNGCFKVIYTLAFNLARRHGIKHIFTGLSRGQIYETRLEPLLRGDTFDLEAIDRMVLEARKVYHRMDDAVSRTMDVEIFNEEAVFDEIQYVDFYRYSDVELSEVYEYLDKHVPWARPTDTGRSTNCLINDVGIYIHKKERGFHNYALPYSWDVRLGHKKLDAALEELDDEIYVADVERILKEINYDEDLKVSRSDKQLVAYYTSKQPLTTSELRKFLADRLPSYMIPSAYMRLEAFPLTPNGKIDRDALPALDSERPDLETRFTLPANETEEALARIWAEALGIHNIGVQDDFFELGGDSIISIQITTRANQSGLYFTPKDLFENPTVKELASVVQKEMPVQSEQGLVEGPVPLTPIQHWFFEHDLANPHHWNQVVHLALGKTPDPALLQDALNQLALHHDALRARFERDPGGWKQTIKGEEAAQIPLTVVDLEKENDGARASALEAINSGLDITSGPIARAALINAGSASTLALAVHHLVVDGVSWSPLLADLNTLLERAAGAQEPLPEKTTSFKQWSTILQDHADSHKLQGELAFWQRQSAVDGSSHTPGPRGLAQHISRSLSPDKTHSLLTEANIAYNTRVPDLLITAVAQAFAQVDGQSAFRLDLEGHGREEVAEGLNLLRTVGWFTSIYPLHFSLPENVSAGEQLMAIKEKIREVPLGGLGHGVLRYLSKEDAFAQDRPRVLFNYLGQLDQVLPPGSKIRLEGPLAASHAAENPRSHMLEIAAYVSGGQLQIDWEFDPDAAERTKALADATIRNLESLIDHCLSPDTGGFTPSDFPDVDLDQDELDSILAEFEE